MRSACPQPATQPTRRSAGRVGRRIETSGGFRYAGVVRPHAKRVPSTRYSTHASRRWSSRPPYRDPPAGFDTLESCALMRSACPQPATQPTVQPTRRSAGRVGRRIETSGGFRYAGVVRPHAKRVPSTRYSTHASRRWSSRPPYRDPPAGFDTLELCALMRVVRPQPATQPTVQPTRRAVGRVGRRIETLRRVSIRWSCAPSCEARALNPLLNPRVAPLVE